MSVPKKKRTNSSQRRRRSHDHLTAPKAGKCEKCGEVKMPHRACPKCGTYKGRQVVKR